jgi:hypothetical protein
LGTAQTQDSVSEARRQQAHRGRARADGCQALRIGIAAQSLDALLAPRPALNAAALRENPLVQGLEIQAAETRDLLLPADLRRMLTDAERSRRKAQSALERARGEQAVLRSLANSARMLRGNTALMNLRLHQARSPARGKSGPTLVLGAAAGPVPLAPDDAAEPPCPPRTDRPRVRTERLSLPN